MNASSWLLVFAGSSLIGGCGVLTHALARLDDHALARWFQRHSGSLERHSSFLLMRTTGAQIARAQVAACFSCLALWLATRNELFAALVIVSAIAPGFLLRRRHSARVAKLEGQLDTWLLMLANALKATASIGEAIASTTALVPPPFSEEVDLLVKELRLGAPLDRALRASACRIDSTLVSGALATIVVARKTGGDLPSTLEQASAALREGARLEGVLRTKTAEGRGQVLVLASVPFVLCLTIAWLDKSWFDPMLSDPIGRAILAGCSLTWLIATLWAHQIAKADL